MRLACAHGKAILLGEHAVVYGVPAVAVGLAQGATATVEPSQSCTISLQPYSASGHADDLQHAYEALLHALGAPPLEATLTLGIPPGCGLGASAAAAVAVARAVLDHIEPLQGPLTSQRDQRILRAADTWEQVFHGQPSGIDATAAVLGGCLVFTRGQVPKIIILGRRLRLAIAVADRPAATLDMVARVARLRSADPRLIDGIFGQIGDLVRDGEDALRRGDVRTLGQLMDRNHQLLQDLTVSTPRLDHACMCARRAGALGAKLTGGGGGGCVIALCDAEAAPVLEEWRSLGLECFGTTLGEAGASLDCT
jgi:mevalonate kinase